MGLGVLAAIAGGQFCWPRRLRPYEQRDHTIAICMDDHGGIPAHSVHRRLSSRLSVLPFLVGRDSPVRTSQTNKGAIDMGVNLTGVVGDLTNLIPSSTDIVQNVILGAGTSVVLAGLKSQAGGDALDPLHIFHKDSPNNNPNNTIGPTITASAFAALPPASQQQLAASGVHIVSG
jgi:hypothetical protein